MVQYVEWERTSLAKGARQHCVAYLPGDGSAAAAAAAAATAPKAVVCFHHGVGEHIGRYREVFSQLADAGIAVYSFDAAGHGQSGGVRALVDSYPLAVDDFEAVCDAAAADVAARFPGTSAPPMFVSGHSMGGLFAALLCLRDQGRWAGLVLCSPALDVEMGLVLRVQAALGNVLAALVPRARIVPAVEPKDMNPDPAKVVEYVKDPLNTVGPLPVRTGNEILKAMRWLRPRWPQFSLPLYVHHGDTDKATSCPASRAFVAAVGAAHADADATLRVVPGGYHEVMFSPGGLDGVVRGLQEWLLQRAAAAAASAGGDGAAAAAAATAAKM